MVLEELRATPTEEVTLRHGKGPAEAGQSLYRENVAYPTVLFQLRL